MTPMESRGLLRGGFLLFALSFLRFALSHPGPDGAPELPGPSRLDALMAASQEEAEDAARRSAPLRPGETLDPNRTPEEELDRLPGIGPVTARAVVAEREENGGFTAPRDLLRVPGIGPSKLEKIRGFLDFSQGVPFELRGRSVGSGMTGAESDGRAVIGPGARGGERAGSGGRTNLNRATAEELQSLPGIGPALAERIVQERETGGPFQNPEGLLRVPGIGPSILARIRDRVSTGGDFLDPSLR